VNLRFGICELRLPNLAGRDTSCVPSFGVSRFGAHGVTRPARLLFFITLLAASSRLYGQLIGPAADEIPPLAPPLPEIPPSYWEQFGWTLWMLIPLLLAMVTVTVWLALRPGKPPVMIPPAAQARVVLRALQAQPESGAILSQISQGLRRYFTNAFWLPPHETTTGEFCALLASHEKIGRELATAVSSFLRAGDERKFAAGSNLPPLGAAGRGLELIELAEKQRLAVEASQQVAKAL
jgi:hypothetical protein